MHFGQNPVAADLAYSIYGEGGKRALARSQADRFYKRLHTAIGDLEIDSLSTAYGCEPLGKSSHPSRGTCGPD